VKFKVRKYESVWGGVRKEPNQHKIRIERKSIFGEEICSVCKREGEAWDRKRVIDALKSRNNGVLFFLQKGEKKHERDSGKRVRHRHGMLGGVFNNFSQKIPEEWGGIWAIRDSSN